MDLPNDTRRVILRDLPDACKFRFAAHYPGTIRHKIDGEWQLTPTGEAERLTSLELGTRVVPLGVLS